jgi:Peptidase M50B-like
LPAAPDHPASRSQAAAGALPDRLTLIAISCLAYIVAVALHEHLGHATTCVLLGGHVKEFGAFYVNCDDAGLSRLDGRLVALAGPFISLITGFVCFQILNRVEQPRIFYFLWLLGSLGLMTATGYMLFSGIAGIGDLGTAAGGAMEGVQPEWLWRAVLTLLGGICYFWVVRYMARRLEPRLNATGQDRIRCAKRVTLISYLTGAAVYLVIGLFNPHGLVILLTSALASSMGGTSGLVWFDSGLNAKGEAAGPGLYFSRSWGWVAIALMVTLIYGAVFGPTLRS